MQDIKRLSTPGESVELLFQEKNITREDVERTLEIPRDVEGNIYLYRPDIDQYIIKTNLDNRLCSKGTSLSPEEEEEIEKQILSTYESLRRTIAEIYREHGAVVHLIGLDADKEKWSPVKKHPDLVIKASLNASNVDSRKFPRSEYLVDEKYHRMEGKGEAFPQVFAPNLKGIPNLQEAIHQMPFEEAKQFVVDTMRGCQALHDEGWVHCDVRSNNAMVNRKNLKDRETGEVREKRWGQLTDLEMAEKEGVKSINVIGLRSNLDKNFYKYPTEEERTVKKAIDVFSFGQIIIELYYGDQSDTLSSFWRQFNQNLLEFYPEPVTQNTRTFDIGAEKIMKAFNTAVKKYPPRTPIHKKVAEMIVGMMRYDREKRPTIDEAIQTLSES
jgi:serine/threonine protein kinase